MKLLDLQFFVRTDRFCCPSIKLSAEFAVSEFRAMEQNLMLLSKNWCTTEFGETEFGVIEIGTQHKIWRKKNLEPRGRTVDVTQFDAKTSHLALSLNRIWCCRI